MGIVTFDGKSGNIFWHISFTYTSHMNFCQFSHKQHISELSSWWDNDLTHHISLHQPLCEPLLDENQHWRRGGFDCLIMKPTMCRLKSFWGIVSPETIRCSRQLYTNAILMAFITNGQYNFFPRMTGLKSDNAASSRSTPPIPRLYAAYAFSSWSELENVCVCIYYFCHFTFILDFFAFCVCFFAGGSFRSLSSPSEVILSISSFLILKTSTSPSISSDNPVVFKIQHFVS